MSSFVPPSRLYPRFLPLRSLFLSSSARPRNIVASLGFPFSFKSELKVTSTLRPTQVKLSPPLCVHHIHVTSLLQAQDFFPRLSESNSSIDDSHAHLMWLDVIRGACLGSHVDILELIARISPASFIKQELPLVEVRLVHLS